MAKNTVGMEMPELPAPVCRSARAVLLALSQRSGPAPALAKRGLCGRDIGIKALFLQTLREAAVSLGGITLKLPNQAAQPFFLLGETLHDREINKEGLLLSAPSCFAGRWPRPGRSRGLCESWMLMDAVVFLSFMGAGPNRDSGIHSLRRPACDRARVLQCGVAVNAVGEMNRLARNSMLMRPELFQPYKCPVHDRV